MAGTIIFACPTLQKELIHALKEAQSRAVLYLLPDELHKSPVHLKSYLQEKIDSVLYADRVIICPSGCGGGTIGLRATHTELVLPRTRDCLDILLSGDNLKDIKRPKHGVFFTESWAEYSKRSSIDVDKVIRSKGEEEGKAFLRKLYKGFEHFYIIDTGVYEIEPVREYLEKLRKILDGQIDIVPGKYGILRKIAADNFDEDFLILKKGETVPESYFTLDRDL